MGHIDIWNGSALIAIGIQLAKDLCYMANPTEKGRVSAACLIPKFWISHDSELMGVGHRHNDAISDNMMAL